MKYFENCKSIEELKKEYRRLVVQNHPDNGGSLEVMKAINAEYEKAFNKLKDIHNEAAKAEGKKKCTKPPDSLWKSSTRSFSLKESPLNSAAPGFGYPATPKSIKNSLRLWASAGHQRKKCGTGATRRTPPAAAANTLWTRSGTSSAAKHTRQKQPKKSQHK